MSTNKSPKSVSAYIDALVWDGQPRLDRWLISLAGAQDTPYVREASRSVLVAAVRRARHPGCKLDEMLVLEGPQGGGKSLALQILAIYDDWFTHEPPISASAKEIVEATAGKWIVELSELRGLGAGDVAALKAFLSSSVDTARPAYQRDAVRVPRAFVIVGTTAETDYLQDATGNRRFWPVRVQLFDLERLRAVRDQLWAEAAVIEASGTPIWVAPPVVDEGSPKEAEPAPQDLHSKILAFLAKEWSRKDSRQLVAVDLVYAPGGGYRDEPIRRWEREDEPEFFAEFVNLERLAGHIVEVSENEVDAKPAGKHRFVVLTQQFGGPKMKMSFAMSPKDFGDPEASHVTGDPYRTSADRQEGSAYAVISTDNGVEFSSLSLDAACTYVGEKLRSQALETSLVNPSSYRIKQVKAG